MDFIHFNSIENILGINAKAIFKVDSSTVFKEDAEMITPVPVDEHLAYMPRGGDNLMPYNIINLIESDETLATCQLFNAEVCFGSGLVYDESTENIRVFGGFLRARGVFLEKNGGDRGVFPVFGKTLFCGETVRVGGLWGLIRGRVGVFAQIALWGVFSPCFYGILV